MDRLTASVLRRYGKNYSIARQCGGVMLIEGVYLAPESELNLGGIGSRMPDHRLLVASESLAGSHVALGDRVVVGAERYLISKIQPDDAGMTSLMLRIQT